MTEQALDTNAVDTAEKPEQEESWGSFLWFCIKLVLAVLLFRTFLFSFFTIPSESMLPGLRTGDYLIAAKWPYGYNENSLPFGIPGPKDRLFASEPKRGDVVVFKHPVDGTDYVKRVIGLPGDTVAMRNGVVILNGEPIRKEAAGYADLTLSPNTKCRREAEISPDGTACRYRRFRETLPSGKTFSTLDFGPVGMRALTDKDGKLVRDSSGNVISIDPDNTSAVIVPEGKLFVMGDNRDNSMDGRFPALPEGGVGIIDQKLLVARASVVLWSTDGSAEWLLPWTWFTAARWDRIGSSL
ncbi:signal peptidase I [Qipengyuania sp. 6B39]|uniref:signal peptidase I n=1 Tax=Qipengyuania proteolytica TaxID=2867239 RepID=UPI001C896D2D|nr:signal peptidase I [Qipengyuania proteolytica]MBX7495483.1 signal peptidase I [Qipengyuania proteolytica]